MAVCEQETSGMLSAGKYADEVRMMKKISLVLIAVGIVIGLTIANWDQRKSQLHPEPATQTNPASDSGDSQQWVVDAAALTKPAPMDSSAPSGTSRYALHDAAAKGLIEYEIHGTGSSSGASLLVGIRRLVDTNIDIYVIPGSVMRPSSDSAQPMVVWGVHGTVVSKTSIQPVASMYLPDNEVHIFVLEAYCLDFHLDNPAAEVTFQPKAEVAGQPVSQAVDLRAAQLIYQGKRGGFSISGIQVAIWADHNNVTKQEIRTKFTVGAKEIDDAFEMAKNMPPPQLS
jgi:hypothetical protein